MKNVDMLYDQLVYFTAVGSILWPFDIFMVVWYIFPVLVCCAKKNLATLTTDRFKFVSRTVAAIFRL
jgi:hypothetical protein